MTRELVGYCIRAEGLCDDGRFAAFNYQILMNWLERAVNPWGYLAQTFLKVQQGLLILHSDIDPKKLKWSVSGMFSVRPDRERLVRRQRPTSSELTAAELARLP